MSAAELAVPVLFLGAVGDTNATSATAGTAIRCYAGTTTAILLHYLKCCFKKLTASGHASAAAFSLPIPWDGLMKA